MCKVLQCFATGSNYCNHFLFFPMKMICRHYLMYWVHQNESCMSYAGDSYHISCLSVCSYLSTTTVQYWHSVNIPYFSFHFIQVNHMSDVYLCWSELFPHLFFVHTFLLLVVAFHSIHCIILSFSFS